MTQQFHWLECCCQRVSKQKVKTGDVFLVWRMRQMINAGTLEVQGDWAKGWKEIVLKLAGSNTPANETVESSTL